MKVVINECHGGFGLSHEAKLEFWKKKEEGKIYWTSCPDVHKSYSRKPIPNPDATYDAGIDEKDYVSFADIPRDDSDLIVIVEKLKEKANGRFAELKVVEIPDDIEWEIEEYDGAEWVAEKHRTWE